MKRKHRLFAVLTTLLLGLMMCAVNVSALGMEDSAVYLSSGSKKSFILSDDWNEHTYFTFTLPKDGEINITCRTECYSYCGLLDSTGKDIVHYYTDVGSGGLAVREMKKTLTKGTYYIAISRGSSQGSGSGDIVVTYPGGSSGDSKASNSSKNSIKIYLEVGDRIDLGAVTGSKDINAKWSSSDSKVAKVNSKGRVTAKGAGTCVITWKSGSESFSIYIEVE